MTGKGLSGIQLVFTDGDFSVIFAADGVILSLIGIIKIEEIMSVKRLPFKLALMAADDNIFPAGAGPVID